MFGLNPRCLINQTRAALASEIAPAPLVLYAAPVLQLRQEHDVNKRPDESGALARRSLPLRVARMGSRRRRLIYHWKSCVRKREKDRRNWERTHGTPEPQGFRMARATHVHACMRIPVVTLRLRDDSAFHRGLLKKRCFMVKYLLVGPIVPWLLRFPPALPVNGPARPLACHLG